MCVFFENRTQILQLIRESIDPWLYENLRCRIFFLKFLRFLNLLQKPEGLTTISRSDNNKNIYLSINDFTSAIHGQFTPAWGCQGNCLFQSTKAMKVIGKAFIVLLMEVIGFTKDDQAKRHHGGYLGKKIER